MNWIKATTTVASLSGLLAGHALGADGILLTLDTDHPQLKQSDTGDVIDYYGPCDESPTGKDQVTEQRQEEQHHWRESFYRG